MHATLTLGPGPSREEPAYGWLHAEHAAPVPLAEWDNPEALTLTLARAGWTPTDRLALDTRTDPSPAAAATALTALPPSVWICPPWCTACLTRPALDVYTDQAGRVHALLVHSQLLGTVGAPGRTWSVWRAQRVTLTDPPRSEPPAPTVRAPLGPCALTKTEAEHLAELLTLAASLVSDEDRTNR